MRHKFRDEFDALAESDLPVVLIDETVHKVGLGFINHDAGKGSKAATEHLLELGHTRIGYVRYGIHTSNHTQRFRAYKTALQKDGIDIPDHWHIETDALKPLCEAAYQAALQLIKQAPELTAIMASNDMLSLSAIKAIVDSGKKIPQDISVVGFDNYNFSEYFNPSLTTVNHPIREIGFKAAEAIDTYFQNPKHTPLPQLILPTKLIVRDSTCPPRKI
jgi:DNA-binding LacI/PurR family transcriptional regulator